MPVVQQFAYKPKAQTTRGDIGRGQMYIEHLSPSLFLELQATRLHSHTGVDSQQLPADATPYMVRGQKIKERQERNSSQWTGGASDTGALIISFGNRFNEVPTILATPSDGDVDVQCVVGSKSTTGFTLTWKDDTTAVHVAVTIDWIAQGI